MAPWVADPDEPTLTARLDCTVTRIARDGHVYELPSYLHKSFSCVAVSRVFLDQEMVAVSGTRVLDLSGNPLVHPHVFATGELCVGDAGALVKLSEWRQRIVHLLTTINLDSLASPYAAGYEEILRANPDELPQAPVWSAFTTCAVCGRDPSDLECNICRRVVCGYCQRWCSFCEQTVCEACWSVRSCEACADQISICANCDVATMAPMEQCARCGDEVCDDCACTVWARDGMAVLCPRCHERAVLHCVGCGAAILRGMDCGFAYGRANGALEHGPVCGDCADSVLGCIVCKDQFVADSYGRVDAECDEPRCPFARRKACGNEEEVEEEYDDEKAS